MLYTAPILRGALARLAKVRRVKRCAASSQENETSLAHVGRSGPSASPRWCARTGHASRVSDRHGRCGARRRPPRTCSGNQQAWRAARTWRRNRRSLQPKICINRFWLIQLIDGSSHRSHLPFLSLPFVQTYHALGPGFAALTVLLTRVRRRCSYLNRTAPRRLPGEATVGHDAEILISGRDSHAASGQASATLRSQQTPVPILPLNNTLPLLGQAQG